MITERDLQEAIAECQGERNPNAQTCIKLAAYYTILNEMTGHGQQPFSQGYSGAYHGSEIDIKSESEFAHTVNGRDPVDVWPVVDELMQTLEVVNPRLYASVIKKLG